MGEMQQQVYQVHDIDELKQCSIDVWYGFEQRVFVLHLCKRKTFWALNLNPHKTYRYVVLHIILVNFVNIKPELLCYIQQNFASFGLLYFARCRVTF